MKSSRGITVVEVLVAVVGLLIFLALLYPTFKGPVCSSTPGKRDVTQIATAVIAFETEYGYLPGTNRQVVGGDVLAALMGSNSTINPRKIVFLEVQRAKIGRSGVTNGTFVDPGGGPYEITFASGTNVYVKAGTNEIEVRKRVAVWNDPNLGEKSSWWRPAKKERRYFTSWD